MESIASTSTPAVSSPKRKCDEGTGMTPDEEMEDEDEDEEIDEDDELIAHFNVHEEEAEIDE